MSNDNVQQFIELYNIFDDLLRDRYHEQSRSLSMINRYINQLEKSSSIANHKRARKINMLRILRNNLVHEFDFNSDNLLDITDETINFLKEEIEELKHPVTALSISTKIERLYYVDLQQNVKDVLKNMAIKGHTQVPVLENKKIIGVFSPNVMFAYLAKYGLNKEKDLKIKDLIDYLPCKKHISEKYEFVERDAYLDDVIELFDDSHRENKKLVAIFVTEHGDDNQAVLGMIVPIDIIKNS